MKKSHSFLEDHHDAVPESVSKIGAKVLTGERLADDEALVLFEEAPVSYLGSLANSIRTKKHGKTTYFNRNFHIEPTNICVFDCKFCSYSRKLKKQDEGWTMTEAEMLQIVDRYTGKSETEVHIVGGVHPKMGLEFFGILLSKIKERRPDLHIKGYTAVELEYMIRKAGKSYKDGLAYLMERGLDSLPGGGAEIFDPEIRKQICADKCTAAEWLEVHRSAHELGMKTNATILYGHIEGYKHRISHLAELRKLQDKTGGFNAFIPLKFRNGDNQMSDVAEVNLIEDAKMFSMARIYLDNFKHIKAYWPMIGRDTAQLLQDFGVNDLDGTIDDTTKIYSMAGAEEQHPAMNTAEIVELIKNSGHRPVERDSLYNELKYYDSDQLEESASSHF